MINQIITVCLKELLDARRDLKALVPAMMTPVIFALLTFGAVFFLANLQNRPVEIELPVQGAERAIPLMDALREAGVRIVDAPEDPATAVKSRELDMVLIIPDEFEQQFRSQQPAYVSLVWDVSRMQKQSDVHFIRQLIQRWSATTGALRLLVRGVSPDVAQVLAINDVNVATDQQMVGTLFASLPILILLLAFLTGAGMASEMAAGERENRTFEPVLATPISHAALFAGKWSAAISVALVLSVAGVFLQMLALNLAPIEQLGLRMELTLGDFIRLLLILIPVIFLATAAQLLVSFLSKSFKDAQAYNQWLMLLPMLPAGYLLLADTEPSLTSMIVPLLGPQMVLVEIFSGNTVPALWVVVAGVSSLLAGALCAVAAVFVMRQER